MGLCIYISLTINYNPYTHNYNLLVVQSGYLMTSSYNILSREPSIVVVVCKHFCFVKSAVSNKKTLLKGDLTECHNRLVANQQHGTNTLMM